LLERIIVDSPDIINSIYDADVVCGQELREGVTRARGAFYPGPVGAGSRES